MNEGGHNWKGIGKQQMSNIEKIIVFVNLKAWNNAKRQSRAAV